MGRSVIIALSQRWAREVAVPLCPRKSPQVRDAACRLSHAPKVGHSVFCLGQLEIKMSHCTLLCLGLSLSSSASEAGESANFSM